LRWLNWHSKLEKGKGDAVIVSASSNKHLEQNLLDLEREQLPDKVVEAVLKAYTKLEAVAPKYWL
jgi:aflatoxin B1 aldehyde reductase